ncbi:MAG TPA: nicotinate-nucleotide adenylyltransferase [Fluviicoccus sp.]|nr:nicotinate-nucleotide adenylyltransferase [Fluviicoccus sp.]
MLPLAYFGGSFNPVHLGHLQTAQELRERFHFAQLALLPAARSPLKQDDVSAEHRLAMARLAVQDQGGLSVDDRECRRPPPSYTIDTLRELRTEHGPDRPLVFILGLDSLLSINRWRDWRHLTDFAHLLVVTRPGWTADFVGEIAEWLAAHAVSDARMLECFPYGRILLAETIPHAVSSTAIRAALHQGAAPETLPLPSAVAGYIRQHHLYGVSPPHESRTDF